MPVERTVVGLDIGSSGLRAAQFSLGKKTPVLRKFASTPLPRGAVQAGVVVDVGAVSQALKSLWAEAKFSTKEVVFGIANDSVLVRQMDLDWMEPADFRKALPYQVADFLPVPVETANLDYHVLGEFDAPGENGTSRPMVRILLVAAAMDMVDGFVQALRGAGLRPVKADLVPFALIRATRPGTDEPEAAEAIVDLGADILNVVVHQGGQPRFVRIISSLGGNQITAALEAQFDWSHDEAERFKIELGLPVQAEDTDSDLADPLYDRMAGPRLTLAHPAQEIIDGRVSAIVTEVATTLDFFLSASPDVTRLSRVVLAGAGSQMIGLSQRLTSELRVPVEHLTPFAVVSHRRAGKVDAEHERQMTVAVGLCAGVQ
jgi:type IV pilus assembly protein PilM